VPDDFDKERAQTRPKERARGTFLHFDNAPTHRADDDFDHVGITRSSHPPYGPDLAPCDFCLFGNLKIKLERNTSTNAMELMAKVDEILTDILSPEFISVFDERKPRLVEWIDTRGDYL
jgi:hypothetical protein